MGGCSIDECGVPLTDDNMLPDSLKGFAPVVRGIAKSNAQITIKQNGYTIYHTYVSPGAFEISDLYSTSSSGDLLVEIKEADGSVNSYSVPFSSDASTIPTLMAITISNSTVSDMHSSMTMMSSFGA